MMYDLFIQGNDVAEMLHTCVSELPFKSRKMNCFFIIESNNEIPYLNKDKYGRFHIWHHTAPILKVFEQAMKAKKMFIIELFSKYNVVIRGSDTIIEVIRNNNVFLEQNQISQMIVPAYEQKYLITKIELPDNIEKSFIVSSAICAELKNKTNWLIDDITQAKVKKIIR